MLPLEILIEFEKGLNPQQPAESKIPARIVGYGEISAIFEIEADKIHVYKRLPLFDSLSAAEHYQQMYRDYSSLLVKAGLCLPAHTTRIVAVPGRPAALWPSSLSGAWSWCRDNRSFLGLNSPGLLSTGPFRIAQEILIQQQMVSNFINVFMFFLSGNQIHIQKIDYIKFLYKSRTKPADSSLYFQFHLYF